MALAEIKFWTRKERRKGVGVRAGWVGPLARDQMK